MVTKKIYIFLASILIISNLVSCTKTEEKKQETKKTPNNIEKKVEKKEIKMSDIEVKDIYSNILSGKDDKNLKEKAKKLFESEKDENKIKALYIESFLGNTQKALEMRKKLCKETKKDLYCKKTEIQLKSGLTKDTNGDFIKDVKISINGNKKSNLKGTNNLNLYDNIVHKAVISKKGYGDYYQTINIKDNNKRNINLEAKLIKADKIVEIDNNSKIKESTKNFNYEIESNSFVKENGEKVDGKIDLVMFDIDSSDGNINYLNLPAFSENGTVLGDGMITFGMPLIKAYSGNEELKINKEIIGKGKIQNIDSTMDFKNVPKNKYLSRNELLKYNIPPFWRLDQKIGVWHESKMKILDEKGNYEFKIK